jgi:hypothetical protein
MEFFLAMPFLFFILAMSVNVGKVFLAQQRAMAAVRYMAWSDIQRKPQPTAKELSKLFFRGEPIQVSHPSVDNVLTARDLPDGGIIDLKLGSIDLGAFLDRLSQTGAYQVDYKFTPIYGKHWAPDLPVKAVLIADTKDWRYGDESIWSLLGKAVGGAISAIFKLF